MSWKRVVYADIAIVYKGEGLVALYISCSLKKHLLTRGAWAATGYNSRLVCLLPEARGRPRV